MAALKNKFVTQLRALREIFPDWTAEDLVFALQEVEGDISLATDRIATGTGLMVGGLMVGHASQWGQVKKKSVKEKVKTQSTTRLDTSGAPPSRGGGRGRGTVDRGTSSRGRGGTHPLVQER
jgi:CUE domain